MEHRQIESVGGVTHYWISRNEAHNQFCIVFTHGLTANHSMFERQVEYFSEKYTIITWDVPLHGDSRPYKDFSYENAAQELKSIIKAERIERVVLVGMSMGGYPSQMFACHYPDMVLGFVAIDTTPFGTGYYSRSDQWWLKRVEPLAKLFPDKMLRRSMAKSVSKTQYSYNMMMKMLQPLSKTDICRQMGLAYNGFLKENRDMKFSFPVLILLGECDKTGKVKQYCEQWAKNEGYPLHVIRGAAHFSNGDNPEMVNKEIEAFVEMVNG